MCTNEKFTIGTPVMCWNNDNMENAKMRVLISLQTEKFAVVYPGYDGNGYLEYFDHICNIHEYRRYISTPNYLIIDKTRRYTDMTGETHPVQCH
jgi:hypothetical protein